MVTSWFRSVGRSLGIRSRGRRRRGRLRSRFEGQGEEQHSSNTGTFGLKGLLGLCGSRPPVLSRVQRGPGATSKKLGANAVGWDYGYESKFEKFATTVLVADLSCRNLVRSCDVLENATSVALSLNVPNSFLKAIAELS